MGPTRAAGRARPGAPGGHAGALKALAIANARYWPTVAAQTRRELQRWGGPASEIDDVALRRLALEKLREEHFNAEVATTLATLAPRGRRAAAVRATVALELLFDYLDGRTEGLALEDSQRLFRPFLAAVELAGADAGRDTRAAGAARDDEARADSRYLWWLSDTARASIAAMPARAAVSRAAHAAGRRCAEAQARIHAIVEGDATELERWASGAGADGGLGWREFAAGSASSVLSVHALIAASADARTSEREAQRLDHAYLAIGAVVTLLDSLVDRAQDAAALRAGYVALYERAELAGVLEGLAHEALARAREAPNGDHHAMTLAGVVAYYTTHPGARETQAREAVRRVRAELWPTIWPTLAVMRAWRAAKRVRRKINAGDESRDGGGQAALTRRADA
jgi:tetraprenyl-beta-curcumene synthase